MISLLSWNKTFETGISEIDQQHQQWIAIFNEFLSAIKDNSETTILESTLAKFMEYSRIHFSTEEKYMQRVKYPSYALHRKIHESFVVKTRYYAGLLSKHKKDDLAQEIWNFIKDWMVNHILIEDKKIKVFIEERQRKIMGG